MDDRMVQNLRDQKQNFIESESRKMFNNLLHIGKGVNFKKNISLNDLIEDKIKDDTSQFKLYVGLIDDIIEYCYILFNLDISNCNLTMDLTANQVMGIIIKKYLEQEKSC